MYGFWTDAAMATPFVGGKISALQKSDGSTGPGQYTAYSGDPDLDLEFDVEANPGVDPITVSILDAQIGVGQEANAITLAASQGDLATNTPGDPLAFIPVQSSGPGTALEVWIQVLDLTGAAAPLDTDLSLTTQVLRSLPV